MHYKQVLASCQQTICYLHGLLVSVVHVGVALLDHQARKLIRS